MVVTRKNNIFYFFPSILFCQISLANLASGQDKTTGLAFKVLASGIGQVVNFADWACYTNSRAAGL